MREILRIENLEVEYENKVKALENISFDVYKGEILGIVGESGSGKTTLALSIVNLLPEVAIKKGNIFFENINIFSLKENELNKLRGKKINFIFQSPYDSFDPLQTMANQFREYLKEKLEDKSIIEKVIYDSLKKARIDNIGEILGSYPHQLSGGQLQRVSIAFAISTSPSLLIADEPTSNLDVTVESQIAHLFLKLKKFFGLTIIFITHNLELAKFLCDRIAVIYQGRLVEIAQVEEIFNNPKNSYTEFLVDSFKRVE